jgi:ATP synthase protein I
MSPTTRPPAESGPNQNPDPDVDPRAAGRESDAILWSIVGHMAASIAVYGGVGYLLGRWTGHPILLLFGILFGVVLSLWYTIHSVNRAAASEQAEPR